MSLGQRLRRLREERGLTLAQVAAAARISVSHLSAIENETRRNPSFHIVARLARVYGVPMDSLVEDEGKKAVAQPAASRGLEGPPTSYVEMARRLAEADALSHPARLLEVIAALLREREQAYEARQVDAPSAESPPGSTISEPPARTSEGERRAASAREGAEEED
ncbi:helix-turn-helix domain-containing protein [Alicyclobacillus vulcanalis]|uniref:Transcriptional regulator, contains XRE-family HTH domain n=1 Tax=Alicyclobacillus vulcanalis TaxID=252246 RepID=A0A1N7JZV8_9BACL|nr:helix-turn-helix domain-containing protein [Alicyclobacillus vulcanalis]SIS54860.1 Transcriptional regulator, contains XRE-family HTH domain [Alicyclobacillus vulcanalis]